MLGGGSGHAGSGGPLHIVHFAPVWSPGGEWISFLQETATPYIVRPDGTGLRQAPLLDDYAWSPDGSRIATSFELTLYDVRSGTRTPLRRYRSAHPSWSPDGRRIAFAAGAVNANDIRVIGADGFGEGNLTETPTIHEFSPWWSPRGDLIAFLTPRGVEVIRPDGTGRRSVYPKLVESRLAWSPDGSRLAFVRRAGPSVSELSVVDVAAGAQRVVERGALHTGTPSWSPDSSRIAYGVGAFPYGESMIHVARADSGRIEELREGAFPAWSPDGTRLAFVSLEGCHPARWGVVVALADGSEAGRLTNECWILGTEGADALTGTSDYDFIDGREGDDRIAAGYGKDLASGGAGSDVVLGQEGADSLAGGTGDDAIDGGGGRDTIVGGPGRDNLLGGIGKDDISARDGEVDVVRCGSQRDVVRADRVDLVARDCEAVARA